MKSVKTTMAWCVLGPICALLVIAVSPFLLIVWADEFLTTRDMSPEELEEWEKHKRFLSSQGGPYG